MLKSLNNRLRDFSFLYFLKYVKLKLEIYVKR